MAQKLIKEQSEVKEKKQLSKKKILAIVIPSCIISLILFIFILLFIIGSLLPNPTRDEEFITAASSLVTCDYETAMNEIKEGDKLINLKKVYLWDIKGEASFLSDLNNLYITNLKWISKEPTQENIALIADKITEIYDQDYTTSDEDGSYTWKIYAFKSDIENISKITLVSNSDEMVLEWTTSNNAYEINAAIENLGNITLDSKADLKQIESDYNRLDEEYKKYVVSYNKVEKAFDEYYELYVVDFNEKAKKAFETCNAEDYDTFVDLKENYEQLEEKFKKKITTYDLVKKGIKKASKSKRKEVIKRLDEYKGYGLSDIFDSSVEMLLEDYCDILTEEDIEKYLVYAVASNALSNAESELKKYLKNPSSYVRYDYGIGVSATHVKGNTYNVRVRLEYGATNSFNAMVKGSTTLYCTYKVTSSDVSFVSADLSAYDKWQLYK